MVKHVGACLALKVPVRFRIVIQSAGSLRWLEIVEEGFLSILRLVTHGKYPTIVGDAGAGPVRHTFFRRTL